MTQSNLQPGYTQFYDRDVPGLHAGTYEIAVTQALPNSATDQFSQTVTQVFEAQGPQFTLDNADIHMLFPAQNASGDFSQVLPNILLENSKLPWERLLTSDPQTPWMALLVFKSDEVVLNPLTNSPVITSSVRDFLAPVAGVVKPSIQSSSLSQTLLDSSMNSIVISTGVFKAVTPRLVELASLAHVREVDPEHQALDAGGADPWYAALMSNRFPDSANPNDTAGAVNYVHLVSLEGLAPYLVDAPAWPTGALAVQLVSLAAWRFVSTLQAGQTFGDLAQNLIASAGGNPSNLALKIPITSDGSAAAQRIALGYTALSYHTQAGPDTFTWYRGPFSPVPPQPLPPTIDFYRHPSMAEIYDQANGIFDQSYGSAWTIGRLAALSDPEFIDSLQRTRSRVLQVGRRLLERSKMPHLRGLSLEELAAPGITRKSLGRNLIPAMFSSTVPARTQLPQAVPTVRRAQQRTNFLFPQDAAPHNPATELSWFLGKQPISNFLTAQIADDLDPMATWLAKLALLYNIPFNHLVPDQRMLPVESVRFFYVDNGWLEVLLDAAMTIGVHGSRDAQVNGLVAPELLRRAHLQVPLVRRKLLRKTASTAAQVLPSLPQAGMLLRSDLVSGWPGLQVQGTAAGMPVNAMRMDRVAPNVLLVLWQSVPDTVTLSQPQQGLAFGVEESLVALRSLNTANLGQQLGTTYPSTGNISQFYRAATGQIGQQVLQLVPSTAGSPGYLIPGLQQALGCAQLLTPAQFAIQMVNAPEQIQFNPPLSNGGQA